MWEAAIPLISSAISGLFNQEGASDANKMRIWSAQQQMDFQERMSNTQYQRQVEDLKAAGLNPMLGYMKGGMQGTPGGAMATGIENEAQTGVGAATSSAITAATLQNMRAQNEKIRAETDATTATAAKTRLETNLQIPQLTDTSAAQAALTRSQDVVARVQYNKIQQEVHNLAAQEKLTQAETQKVLELTKNAVEERQRTIAQTGNIKIDTVLKKLEIPLAQNMAKAQESWWMRTVNPYVPSAIGAARAGGALGLRYYGH